MLWAWGTYTACNILVNASNTNNKIKHFNKRLLNHFCFVTWGNNYKRDNRFLSRHCFINCGIFWVEKTATPTMGWGKIYFQISFVYDKICFPKIFIRTHFFSVSWNDSYKNNENTINNKNNNTTSWKKQMNMKIVV